MQMTASPRAARGAPKWLVAATLWCALAAIVTATSTSVVGCGDSKRLRVATAVLPASRVNTLYSAILIAGGRTGNVIWQVMSGALPPGVTLNGATGAITGTPTTIGTFHFGVVAVDSKDSAFAALTIEVYP
jgi:hypothetical protein